MPARIINNISVEPIIIAVAATAHNLTLVFVSVTSKKKRTPGKFKKGRAKPKKAWI